MNSTISGVKARARLLMSHLEGAGKTISYSEALEALSASENNSDWNRYQAALKSKRSASAAVTSVETGYQPHKIFAAGPGMGSATIAELVFAQNIHAGQIPIIIQLREQTFPANKFHDTSGWIYIDVEYDRLEATNISKIDISEDIKGIIIRPCIENWPGRDLAREAEAAKTPDTHYLYTVESTMFSAMSLIFRDINNWDSKFKERLGTVILYGMERALISSYHTYSRTLPKFMSKLRTNGGTQNLFIITDSDNLKNDILKSADEYKLIISEVVGGSIFGSCPVEKLFIEQDRHVLINKWNNLFTNKSKVIEDICLFIGALSHSFALKDIENENPTFEFAQNYLQGIISSDYRERRKTDSSGWESRAYDLFSMVASAIESKNKKSKISLMDFKKHLPIENLYDLYIDPNVDKVCRDRIAEYFHNTPGVHMATLNRENVPDIAKEQHGFLIAQMTLHIPSLLEVFNFTD